MRYPKLRELKEAIKALFKGPYTSKYPYQPIKTYERFRGRPYFHKDDCTGCAACVQVCPTGALEFKDELSNGVNKRVLTVHWDVCIFCGQCQANCLTQKGIILSNEFDFATTEKREDLKNTIEKELVLCECCGEVIAPLDQYSWVANKLGSLCFSNASLLLFYLRNLGVALKESVSAAKNQSLSRASRIKILCPNCRREAVLKS